MMPGLWEALEPRDSLVLAPAEPTVQLGRGAHRGPGRSKLLPEIRMGLGAGPWAGRTEAGLRLAPGGSSLALLRLL